MGLEQGRSSLFDYIVAVCNGTAASLGISSGAVSSSAAYDVLHSFLLTMILHIRVKHVQKLPSIAE